MILKENLKKTTGNGRPRMAALFFMSIYPHYYAWWAYFNYYNDDYYNQWWHQVSNSLIIVTEAVQKKVTPFQYVSLTIKWSNFLVQCRVAVQNVCLNFPSAFLHRHRNDLNIDDPTFGRQKQFCVASKDRRYYEVRTA